MNNTKTTELTKHTRNIGHTIWETVKDVGFVLIMLAGIIMIIFQFTHGPLHVENKNGTAYIVYGDAHLGANLLDENDNTTTYKDYKAGEKHKLISARTGSVKQPADAVVIYDEITNTIYVGSGIHKDYRLVRLEPYFCGTDD